MTETPHMTKFFQTTRCTPFEKQAVELFASRHGITQANALRHLVRLGAMETGVWPLMDAPPPDPGNGKDATSE